MSLVPLDSPLPLTEECLHYNHISEVPEELKKYFHQRHSIFTYYDYDIRLTHDAWFGVTPEPVALQIAEDIRSCKDSRMIPKDTIIDMFAGAGGNTIAFALSKKWSRVIAIEKDAATLACAQHNAVVYGVYHCITWVHGDSLEVLARMKDQDQSNVDHSLQINQARTIVFASPPWGGVSYRDQDVFDLSTMQPYNLETLYAACWPMEHVLFLPRTSDIRQVAALAPKGDKIEVAQYCQEGASKAMVAYIPEAW